MDENNWTFTYLNTPDEVCNFFWTLSPNQIKWSKLIKDDSKVEASWTLFYPKRNDYMLNI